MRLIYAVDEVFELFLDAFVLALTQRHFDVFAERLHQQSEQPVDLFFGRLVREPLLVEVIFHRRTAHVLRAVVAVLVVAFERRPDLRGPLLFLDVLDTQWLTLSVDTRLADADESGAAGDALKRHAT